MGVRHEEFTADGLRSQSDTQSRVTVGPVQGEDLTCIYVGFVGTAESNLDACPV
jgi:hypothetical protein